MGLIGLMGLIRLIGLMGLMGLMGLIGLIGLMGFYFTMMTRYLLMLQNLSGSVMRSTYWPLLLRSRV